MVTSPESQYQRAYNEVIGGWRYFDPELLVKVDEASSTTTYVGEAVPGTASSDASWRIKKITESGTVTTIAWADGNSSFDNVWDNRASLSYS